VPRQGGWDFLSQLLAESPLMPTVGNTNQLFSDGSIFKSNNVDSRSGELLNNAQADYLLELIDRCR